MSSFKNFPWFQRFLVFLTLQNQHELQWSCKIGSCSQLANSYLPSYFLIVNYFWKKQKDFVNSGDKIKKMFKSRETQRAAALRAWWKGDKLPEKYIWQIGQIYWRKSDKYIWQLREILDVEKSSDPTSSCAPGLMKRVINYQNNISPSTTIREIVKSCEIRQRMVIFLEGQGVMGLIVTFHLKFFPCWALTANIFQEVWKTCWQNRFRHLSEN